MEEDLKIIEEMLRLNKNRIEPQIINAIENLINKNKELEKERDGIYADYQELGKEKLELEKMIELMAEYIDFDKMDFNCSSLCVKEGCREECVIEFFRKKAKGE